MKCTGTIIEWNDERGFGFIEPQGGGKRAFVHISAIRHKGHRPVSGDAVTYRVGKDSKGRLQASHVSFVKRRKAKRGGPPRVALAVVATVAIGVLYALHWLPLTVVGIYAVASAIAFLLYAKDKNAAKRNRWRTPEQTLHTISLLGGWPGALLGQRVFHHKTTKQPFQFFFWITVLANVGGIWWLLTSGEFYTWEALVQRLKAT